MKRWIRGFAAIVCALLVLSASSGPAALSARAEAQTKTTARDLRIANQEQALGAQVNTGADAKNITLSCKLQVSEGEKRKLINGNVGSTWSYSGDSAWIGIQLPDKETAGVIQIEWLYDPTGFELIEYDAGENELRRRTQEDVFPSICTTFALLPETRIIRLRLTAPKQQIGGISVYSEGVLPNDVQTWLPPVEKADLMVFSTHQDDEVIFLGGTIPYSDVVCGRPTITVYMTNCSRSRRREALECLWVMGSRTYPEFINLKDKKVGSISSGIKLWGGKDNILEKMVERIRRYKPEVIVTQDFNGEYGHNQHKILARATPYAIEAAADPTRYPDSYEKYGAWQVKKLYIHLYEKNKIKMDWLTPQKALGGLTLLKVAQNGMAKHASQTKYFSVKNGGKYDNAKFGLYMSTVGEDVAKNDFFENIDPNASANYLAEARASSAGIATQDASEAADDGDGEPDGDGADDLFGEDEAPAEDSGEALEIEEETSVGTEETDDGTDEAVEEQTEVGATATPEPTAEPTAAPAAGTVARETGGGGVWIAVALIGLGVAAAGGGAWYYSRMKKRRRRRRRRRSGTAQRAKKT